MAGQLFSKATINFAVNTQNALQQITGFQQKFSNSISQMKTGLMGFLGYQGIKGAYHGLTNLVDTAEKLNMPVEKMSQWANLFSVFGGSTEEATASLEKFDKLSRDLKFHSSGPLRELSAVLRTNLNNKDFDGLISAFRSQWGHLNDDAKREVLDMLGADAPALRRIIGASSAEFEKAKHEADRMHKITKDEADSILQMEKNLATLKKTLTDTAIPILQAFQPILNVIRDIAMAFNDLDETTQKSIIYGFLGATVLSKLGLLKVAFEGIQIAAAAAGTTVSAMVAGIVAIAAALGEIYYLYLAWKEEKKWKEWRKNLTPEKEAYVNQQLADVLGKDQLFEDQQAGPMSKISPENTTSLTDWVGKQSKIDSNQPPMNMSPINNEWNRGHNGDVIQNINIYGVKDAEDMMDRFRTVAEQSITPLMGPQG